MLEVTTSKDYWTHPVIVSRLLITVGFMIPVALFAPSTYLGAGIVGFFILFLTTLEYFMWCGRNAIANKIPLLVEKRTFTDVAHDLEPSTYNPDTSVYERDDAEEVETTDSPNARVSRYTHLVGSPNTGVVKLNGEYLPFPVIRAKPSIVVEPDSYPTLTPVPTNAYNDLVDALRSSTKRIDNNMSELTDTINRSIKAASSSGPSVMVCTADFADAYRAEVEKPKGAAHDSWVAMTGGEGGLKRGELNVFSGTSSGGKSKLTANWVELQKLLDGEDSETPTTDEDQLAIDVITRARAEKQFKRAEEALLAEIEAAEVKVPDLTVTVVSQLDVIRGLMGLGDAWSVKELAEYTGFSEASVSARIRDLRKPQFGGNIVTRSYRDGIFYYRLELGDE